MTKLIIVPKDTNALKALDFDTATPEQLFEVSLDEHQFNLLWSHGFFDLINEIANVNIDNFEDESITDRQALARIISSKIFTLSVPEIETDQLLKRINDIFLEAYKRNTGVFFFF